jgi:hypothetical protein
MARLADMQVGRYQGLFIFPKNYALTADEQLLILYGIG